ncbi:MAG: right-handed parallel beta-helix repeat-containing protein [Cyanobacteria bacterium SID2]|nr:right-handed parallel beta-helix repeat-containing protein [Cyanobacteria bacterium SID2]MBP0004325.1 right-handed parallel beta-helix repeat-containing protein [Cyanobacteria bacterium SBC]
MRIDRKLLRSVLLFSIVVAFGGLLFWGFAARSIRAETSHLWIVAQQHPAATDRNPGTETRPLRTINEAAKRAKPGDTIRVHAGIYRERVVPQRGGEPERPIVYEAFPGEAVVMRGSDPWSAQPTPQTRSNAPTAEWEGRVSERLFSRTDPFTQQLERMSPGYLRAQVFDRSQPLRQVLDLETFHAQPGTWFFDPSTRQLRVHLDRAYSTSNPPFLEISTRRAVFAPEKRGLGYIHVRGFVMEHGANPFPSGFWRSRSTQAGILSTRSGHHWVIERNTIRYAKSLGLDCGSEGRYDIDGLEQPIPEGVGYHVVRDNMITDNGCGGLAGWKQTGSFIAHNIIERNNRLGFTAPETGGIKVHEFIDGQIVGNVIRNNECFGIWVDNVYRGARVSRNLVLNNRGAGIFMEMGGGPALVDNNIVAFTSLGEGIYTHDASGVTVAHNWLQGNTHFGVYMRTVTDRQFDRGDGTREEVATRGQRIFGNVFIDNYRGHLSLPYPAEPDTDNRSNYNLFINGTVWQWEGQEPHRFVWNYRSEHVDRERLVTALREAFDRGDLPIEDIPNFDRWRENLSLSLSGWRVLTGNDRDSVAPLVREGEVVNGAIEKGAISLGTFTPNLEVGDVSIFSRLSVPPLPLPSSDFWGTPLTEEARFPGPFQNWPREGEVHWHLWPVEIDLVPSTTRSMAETYENQT